MSGISRRQMMRGLLLGAATLSARGLAQEQSAVEDVVRAGDPESTIIPPHGIPIAKPRLQNVRRVIVDAEPFRALAADPYPPDHDDKYNRNRQPGVERAQQQGQRNAQQRAEGTGRHRREPGAQAAGEEHYRIG